MIWRWLNTLQLYKLSFFCKTALTWAQARIKVYRKMKITEANGKKEELLKLVQEPNNNEAINASLAGDVLRARRKIAVYNLLETYCNSIKSNLDNMKGDFSECHLDLQKAIVSVIYASKHCSGELKEIRKHLGRKYGNRFVSSVIESPREKGVCNELYNNTKSPDTSTKEVLLRRMRNGTDDDFWTGANRVPENGYIEPSPYQNPSDSENDNKYCCKQCFCNFRFEPALNFSLCF